MAKKKHTGFSKGRERLHEIIFEADTASGKLFDVILLITILASVIVVMLESISSYQIKYGELFTIIEWVFTIFFTIEYLLRMYAVYKPMKYATSFFGIIDLLSILPTYLSFFFVGSSSLMIIRGLRLLRVFRIFKLANFLKEGQVIMQALKDSMAKISVFVSFILVFVSIVGSIMYLVEGAQNQAFDSIPRSIYWAIVTVTTVGYGDISPVTPFGQLLASLVMLAGYAIIAVPTGIVTAEVIGRNNKKQFDNISTQSCKSCTYEGHDVDAVHCKKCGEELN
ncbi:MAG: ion transporter [Saprospiraceae bacterium]